MSENGDRKTPDAPVADWRRADLSEVPLPYAIRAVQHALISLENAIEEQKIELRMWETTLDRRMAACVQQAAEEAADRVAEKILRELARLADRVNELGQDVQATDARASQAEIKAQSAIETGKHVAVTVVNDLPTPIPPSTLVPPTERALRAWVGKRWAHIFVVIAGLIFTLLNAWLASRH